VLAPDISDVTGRHAHAQQFQHLKGRAGQAEREDVLTAAQHVVGGKSRDITRIIEQPVTIHLDLAGVVLA
jgi:hypothetical protein